MRIVREEKEKEVIYLFAGDTFIWCNEPYMVLDELELDEELPNNLVAVVNLTNGKFYKMNTATMVTVVDFDLIERKKKC